MKCRPLLFLILGSKVDEYPRVGQSFKMKYLNLDAIYIYRNTKITGMKILNNHSGYFYKSFFIIIN